MKNRAVYQRDPDRIALLNNGVAAVTDAFTSDEQRTLRFELEHFVCEGQYRIGLERILESYLGQQGQPEQPAAWISGFFGSGKSHLAKMLRFLWTDYRFPDGATARGLARLPNQVSDLLREVTTLGRRGGGLHAAAGTIGTGPSDSVRLALLGIVFRSAGLPESYPQARFCLWLKRNAIYDQVREAVESQGRDFRRELNDLYVSSRIAKALLAAEPNFAPSEPEAHTLLREQYPRPKDISTDAFVDTMHDVLAPDGQMPCTVVILDELQQYIGDQASRSITVQEVVETCTKRFGDRLLFVATGQTALSGTSNLQRLQDRFSINVELSDQDVDTVIRRVILAKRPDRLNDIKDVLDASAGEIDRQLSGTAIAPRNADKTVIVDDYPLLPARRRFWEHSLRAVDQAGTAGQLRTQLRIAFEAVRATADDPLGTVVPADFLFDQTADSLLRSGALLREINETIVTLDDGTEDGTLKSRLCALVFLIRKLPHEGGADCGVRANADTLADLLVKDLARDGTTLRARLPALLDDLITASTLIKLGDEYSLQTRESSEWEAEFRSRLRRTEADLAGVGAHRAQLLAGAVENVIGTPRLLHGTSREPRKLSFHHGPDTPPTGSASIAVWVRDGWGSDERSVLSEARAAGQDDAVVHVFLPKTRPDELARLIATQEAANATLDYKGTPTSREGEEARRGMETRKAEAGNNLRALVAEVVRTAKVFQGGGTERFEDTLQDRVQTSAKASLDRLFPEFHDADNANWRRAIERARSGAEHPLEVLGHEGKTEDHPVCAAVLAFVGPGKRGREVRSHFDSPPYGWPRDAVDGTLISLLGAGHLRASANGEPMRVGQLDQSKVSGADFRVESATISTRQRIELRGLFKRIGVECKANEEVGAASEFLKALQELADGAGGDAPLPQRPDTEHLAQLRSLAGNEQLVAIHKGLDALAHDADQWQNARALADERLPAHRRLVELATHAEDLEVAKDVQPQIAAIGADRSLLAPTDPVPALAATLTDALRDALTGSERNHADTFDEQWQRLSDTESWQQIGQDARDDIISKLRLEKVHAGPTGTVDEVLESLRGISLDDWRTRTAALPQLFANAKAEADRLLEPAVRHVTVGSPTLRTPEDVEAWTETTKADLLKQIEQGPIVVR